MVTKIKNLRVHTDGLSVLVITLLPHTICGNESCDACGRTNSDEIDKSYDSLMLAKAWMGKILQSFGEKTPYANDGKRVTVEDIETAADTSQNSTIESPFESEEEWISKNHIQRVDWLRERINVLLKEFDDDSHMILEFLKNMVTQHLTEARFWLGFELQRIKELEEAKREYAAMTVTMASQNKNEA